MLIESFPILGSVYILAGTAEEIITAGLLSNCGNKGRGQVIIQNENLNRLLFREV